MSIYTYVDLGTYVQRFIYSQLQNTNCDLSEANYSSEKSHFNEAKNLVETR